jgi:hypothetical protein
VVGLFSCIEKNDLLPIWTKKQFGEQWLSAGGAKKPKSWIGLSAAN